MFSKCLQAGNVLYLDTVINSILREKGIDWSNEYA